MKRRFTLILIAGVAAAMVATACKHTGVPAIDRLFMSDQEKSVAETNDESAEALALVKERPEVAAWLARFSGSGGKSPKTGGVARFSVEGAGAKKWTIHAYEDVPSAKGVEGHIATFNWYDVDLTSKTVTPQF